MPKQIDQEKWNKVISIYLDCRSIRATAEKTGYSKTGVDYILRISGVDRFKRNRCGSENSQSKAIQKLDSGDPRKIVRSREAFELYESGLSIPQISEKLRLSRTTVRTGLLQAGVVFRTLSQAISGRPRPGYQGSKHRDWKGGLSGWRKLARGRLNEHFVRPIMIRDGFKCSWCGSKKNLVVHHHNRSFMEIVRQVETRVDKKDLENFITAIVSEHCLDDGITLCKLCHDGYHKEHGK